MLDFGKLAPETLQSIVLMVKSRSAFGQYFNLDPKELNRVWKQYNLMTPSEYVSLLNREQFAIILMREGSYQKAAERLGVSASFLTRRFQYKTVKPSTNEIIASLKIYQSVRLTAWVFHLKESDIRRAVEDSGLKMADLVNYTGSSHNNAKGRRAELFYAEIRGDKITADLNEKEGSKAPYDFDDEHYLKVNVKSGVQQKVRALVWQRSQTPHFWKFSAVGKGQCAYFACVGYDEKHKQPLFIAMVATNWLTAYPNSFYLRRRMDGEIVFDKDPLPKECILYRWSA